MVNHGFIIVYNRFLVKQGITFAKKVILNSDCIGTSSFQDLI